MKNLGILLSGRGSNFEAIAKSIASGKIRDARIAIVISNRTEAVGIEAAKRLGLDTLIIPSKGTEREDHDRGVVAALQQHKVDLVCLAGYMLTLGKRQGLAERFRGVSRVQRSISVSISRILLG